MSRHSSRRGTALIEFAAALIVLSTMFTGVFQVGYTFVTYRTLVSAVSAGARYASLTAANAGDPDYAQAVRKMVVYGDPAATENAKPVVPGLTTEHVSLILGPATASVTLRDFVIDALFTKIKLDGRPTVTFPIRAAVAQQAGGAK